MEPLKSSFWKRPLLGRKESREFEQYLDQIAFERLFWVAVLVVAAYPLFFIADIFLLRDLDDTVVRVNFFVIHSIAFIVAAVFLHVRAQLTKVPKRRINYTYIAFYLLIGLASALNSQKLAGGTIDFYLIIMFAIAIIFPIKPLHFFGMLTMSQLIFLGAVAELNHNQVTILTKQINSTGAAAISLLIGYSFYTKRRQEFLSQAKLKGREENFRRLFSMNPTPLILANLEEKKVLLINRQAREFFTLHGLPLPQLDTNFLFRDLIEKKAILDQLREKESLQNYVMEYPDSGFGLRWAMLNFEKINYMDEECVLVGVSDITPLKMKEQELQRHASFDMLTGILNRRRGIEILNHHINARDGHEFTLCFVDINDLKLVNDRFGHFAGDEMIKTLCSIILGKISPEDTFFRLGGDEFVILFARKDAFEARHLWESISDAFEVFNLTSNSDYCLSASIGLYHYTPGCGATAEEMLELADKEMYKEKSAFKPMGN
ncbi:sensor domain-containing diguanylate cyclase [Bacillus sp. EB01]|uniref:sensor domain-containing diguanylate cyclase n=1 Tax=Bacillus sp. EB01 TaxID=1347086 RepID=UPI000693F6F4|nr:GGDEF domain-containing protein [Bacillus sp. EB01]